MQAETKTRKKKEKDNISREDRLWKVIIDKPGKETSLRTGIWKKSRTADKIKSRASYILV